MSYFMTGDPGKEHRSHKPPPTGGTQERSKGRRKTQVHVSSQNPSCWSPSWLSDAGTTRKTLNENDWPETTQKTISSPENLRLGAARQSSSSGFPYPWLFMGHPFPIKSLALLTCISLDNLFPSVRQEPTLRPWKGPPFQE